MNAPLTLTKAYRDDQTLHQYTYDPAVIDKAVMLGDMKQMPSDMRLAFYRAVCLSVGLNPLTQPFTPLERQDKTVWLYANSSCTQQLSAIHKVSYRDISRKQMLILGEPFYCVEVTAVLPDGRTVPSQSVVSLAKKKKTQRGTWPNGDPKWIDALDDDGEAIMVPLRGEPLANAIMKADTKALRRATLALVGLGWMQADYEGRAVTMDLQTGELREDSRMAPSLPLMALSTEQAKGLAGHARDLYGDVVDPTAWAPPVASEVLDTGATHRPHFEATIAAQRGDLERWYTWGERQLKTGRGDWTVAQWARMLQYVHEAEKLAATSAGVEEPPVPAPRLDTASDVPASAWVVTTTGAIPSSPRRDGPAWDTLRAYQDDARLPSELCEEIKTALSSVSPVLDSEADRLASTVLDVLAAREEG